MAKDNNNDKANILLSRRQMIGLTGAAFLTPLIGSKSTFAGALETPTKLEKIAGALLEKSATLVARPAVASQVKWPTHKMREKDFWIMLAPDWRTLNGVNNEEFVKNAGYGFVDLPYTMEGVLRGSLRQTQLHELQVFSGNENISPKSQFTFTSSDPDEPDTIFYGMDKIKDGDLKTNGYIIGSPTDFRKRNKGVPFQIKIELPEETSVDKLRFYSKATGYVPIDTINIKTLDGKNVDTFIENDNEAGIITASLAKPLIANGLVIEGKTRYSIYNITDNNLSADLKEKIKSVPFSTENFFFRGKIPELEPENIDQQALKKIRETYGETYIGQIVGEVTANFFQKRANPQRFRDDLTQQGYYVPTVDRDRFEAEQSLKTHWKRHVDRFGNLCAMSGGLMTAPYFYEWGVPLVMVGSINEAPFANNRSILTMTRSGARQYGKPWASYQTFYGGGTSPDSRFTENQVAKLVTKDNPWHVGLDFGLAASTAKRWQYLSYYCGANSHHYESQPLGMVVENPDKSWSLTENGKAIKDIYEWSIKPEGKRGDFYAPILLLADYYNGNWEWKRGAEWKTWYLQPYEDGDYMFQHINRSFDPFPGHDFGKDYTLMADKGWSLFNSKLGDIYDVFFANPRSGTITMPELGKYPVVLLTGAVDVTPELFDRLKAYVHDGGTLIINAAQAETFQKDTEFLGVKPGESWTDVDNMKLRQLTLTSAKALLKASNDMPLVTENRFGQGNVIYTTPYFLLNMKDKQQALPLIEAILTKIQEEVCPVKVSGNIHFLFNKMEGNSWKLILMNHRGVYKNPMRTMQHFLPEYAAKVSFTAPTGTSASEVRLKQPILQEGNTFQITIPPGEICVVNLDNVDFNDEPINASQIQRQGGFFEEANRNRGLLLESNFNTQQGDVAADVSGHNNNGVLMNNPVYVTDNGINALQFNGKDSYVVYRIKPNKTPLKEATFECWVKPDSSKRDSKQIVITNRWVIVGFDKGRWMAHYYDLAKSGDIIGSEVEFDKWTHLAFSWKDNIARFYINGEEVQSNNGPMTTINPLDGINDGRVELYLGSHYYTRQDVFKGLITDVRYYGNSLSDKEINAEYAKGVGDKSL